MYRFHKDGTLPQNDEVFVFGSNLAGIHGAGAAKVARERFGAVFGQGFGHYGNSFALPTKDTRVESLPLDQIQQFVDTFVLITTYGPYGGEGFFVTRIGCGLAGYKDEQIAPMFRGAVNCSFAEEWRPYLEE